MKAIQIGTGGMGRRWTSALRNSQQQGWEIAALVDVNEAAFEWTVNEWPEMASVPTFTDAEKALNEIEADVAVIVTPPAFHRSQAEAAFAAGKHVLTEKPQAETLDDAKAMVTAAQNAGKVLMVAQNYRYSASARAIRERIDQGAIGRIGYADVLFQKAPHFGGFREKMQYPLLVDMAIHHFDLIRYLTGGDPAEVYARSWKPEWSWFEHDPSLAMIITMKDGTVVNYFGSWVGVGGETGWNGNWRLQGGLGSILWTDAGATIHPGGQDGETEKIEPIDTSRQGQEAVLDEFAAAFSERRQPETSGVDNLKSLALVFAGVESAQSGRPVSIDI
jgi:predicted dehydrogenase